MNYKSGSTDYPFAYADAGVDEPREQAALRRMLPWFRKTYLFRQGIGATTHSIGHFANLLDMGAGLGLVVTTDGIGTKLLIAQMVGRFDTVGIDCIANNVNDILCMGGEPIALLDYLAVSSIDEDAMEDLAKGLSKGAEAAHISIPGGEIAQVGEMLTPDSKSRIRLDLVGTALGVVGLGTDRADLHPLVDGSLVVPGDVIIGLASTGLHSNGYSLARRVLLDQAGLGLTDYVPELGKRLDEELLIPTAIYVDPVVTLLKQRAPIHGMVHISGGGLLNLSRLPDRFSYCIDFLPEAGPIFGLIKNLGKLADNQMLSTFNMGVGFCIICPESGERQVRDVASSLDFASHRIGRVMDEPGGYVHIEPFNLVGEGDILRTKL